MDDIFCFEVISRIYYLLLFFIPNALARSLEGSNAYIFLDEK